MYRKVNGSGSSKPLEDWGEKESRRCRLVSPSEPPRRKDYRSPRLVKSGTDDGPCGRGMYSAPRRTRFGDSREWINNVVVRIDYHKEGGNGGCHIKLVVGLSRTFSAECSTERTRLLERHRGDEVSLIVGFRRYRHLRRYQ